MKYQTLLFDADGTLLDFARSEYEALSDTLKHFGLTENEAVHRGYSEANAEQWALLEQNRTTRADLKINRFKNFCQRMNFACDAYQMASYYENALSSKSFLLEGAEDICRDLSKHCDLYIVTNGFRHIQTKRLQNTALLPYFKEVFISEEIGAEKPDSLFFKRVASQIPNFKKQTTLIIGDSLTSDMDGGINFGIDTCWFNATKKPAPNEKHLTYTITSLSQLKTIVL